MSLSNNIRELEVSGRVELLDLRLVNDIESNLQLHDISLDTAFAR